MKKVNYLILSSLLFVSFYGYSLDKKETSTENAKTETVLLSENIKALFEENPSTNILYLTLDKVSRGWFWQDEQGRYFFYRLLFASVEDAELLYVEKIEWDDESDYLKLVSRFEIQEKHFGNNWWYDFEPQVEWISPTVVKLSFTTDDWNDRSIKDFYLDLANLKND